MTPIAFPPCFSCPDRSKVTYSAHLSYFVHPGSRKFVTHLLSIQEHIEMSESGDIGGRSFYRFLNRKFFSELGRRYIPIFLPLSSRSTLASPCSPIVTISSFLSFPVQSIWHCSSLFPKEAPCRRYGYSSSGKGCPPYPNSLLSSSRSVLLSILFL